MEITISTDKVTSGGMRFIKTLLLLWFSVGWVLPLGAVLAIPAGMVQSELDHEVRLMQAIERQAYANTEGSSASAEVREAVRREVELMQSNRMRLSRLVNLQHNLSELRIAIAALCIWLASVVAYWSWRILRALAVRNVT